MPSPGKSAPKKVAAKLFILQGGAMPLSYVPVWAEPSQLLIVMWVLELFGNPQSSQPVIAPISALDIA